MATLGYKMNDAKQGRKQTDILHTTRNGIAAFGVYDGEKFEVLEGSQVSDTLYSSIPPKIGEQRKIAEKNGDVVKENSRYILKKSLSFSSPSTAASFVLGTSANGWTEWKNNEGKTIDEIFRKQNIVAEEKSNG